jgi:hypothetical protein
MNQTQKAGRQKRSLKLIANFVDGYAEGWHFAVGKFFREELDIKYTARVVNGKKTMEWTQGRLYNFKEGNTIYDTPKAYLIWGEALKHIKLICEVVRSTPNHLDNNRKFLNGQVTFNLSKPNKDKTGIETIGQYSLSQNDFVEYLRTGERRES